MCITSTPISSLPEKIVKLIGSHDILINQNEWILEFAEWNATNVNRAAGKAVQIYQNGLPLNENTAGNHHANPFGGENGNPDGVVEGGNGNSVLALSIGNSMLAWSDGNLFGAVGGPLGDCRNVFAEFHSLCNQFGLSAMICAVHRMVSEELAVPPYEAMNLPSYVNPYAVNTVATPLSTQQGNAEYSLFGSSQPLVDVLGIVRECTYDREMESKP